MERESAKFSDILHTARSGEINKLAIQNPEFSVYARDLYAHGFKPVDLSKFPEFENELDNITTLLGSADKVVRAQAVSEVENVAMQYLYQDEQERVRFLDTQYNDVLNTGSLDEVKRLALLSVGIGYIYSQVDQGDVLRQLASSMASMGGDQSRSVSGKLTRAMRRRMLNEMDEHFGIENLRRNDMSAGLRDIHFYLVTENNQVGNLEFQFMEVCRALGELVDLDLSLLQNTQLLKVFDEMAKREKPTLSADEAQKATQAMMMDNVEAEAIESLGGRIKALLTEGRERITDINFVEAYNFINGDFGKAYRIDDQLPKKYWEELYLIYPEHRMALTELHDFLLGKPNPKKTLSDDARRFLKKRLYVSKSKRYEKSNSSSSVAVIEPGRPIIFSELKQVDKVRANSKDLDFKPLLDWDPTELDSKGRVKTTCPGGLLKTRSGRHAYLTKHEMWMDHVMRKLNASDEELVGFEPFTMIHDYDEDYQEIPYGLMPDAGIANLDNPNSPNGSTLRKQVLGSSRTGKVIDYATVYAMFTREDFKHHPTDVVQQHQARLKPYLLSRYWDTYTVHSVMARIMADTPFGSMTDRMLSKHSFYQAIEGKDRVMYFRNRSMGPDDFGKYKLQSLKHLTIDQKRIIDSTLSHNKSIWLDDAEPTAVAFVVRNVREGTMSIDEAGGVLDVMNEKRSKRQWKGELTEMKIRANRQMQLATVIGQSKDDRENMYNGPSLAPYLESLGEDLSVLDPEELKGNIALGIACEHEGVELIEFGKVLWDAIKHRNKYETQAEEAGMVGTQFAVALTNSLDELIEHEVSEKLIVDLDDRIYQWLEQGASGLTGGTRQFSGDIRAQFVKSLRETATLEAGKVGWLTAGGVRKHMLERVKTVVAAATGMQIFSNYKLVGKDQREGIGPGVSRDLITLDGDNAVEKELALLLRKKGIQALVRGDSANIEICGRDAKSFYDLNMSEVDTSRDVVEIKGGLELKGNGKNHLYMPNEMVTSALDQTFDHHPLIFGMTDAKGVKEKLCKALGKWLLDNHIFTKKEYEDLLHWAEDDNNDYWDVKYRIGME